MPPPRTVGGGRCHLQEARRAASWRAGMQRQNAGTTCRDVVNGCDSGASTTEQLGNKSNSAAGGLVETSLGKGRQDVVEGINKRAPLERGDGQEQVGEMEVKREGSRVKATRRRRIGN